MVNNIVDKENEFNLHILEQLEDIILLYIASANNTIVLFNRFSPRRFLLA